MKIVLIIFLVLCYLVTGFIIMDWYVDRTTSYEKISVWWVNLLVLLLWPLVVVLTSILVVIAPIYKFGLWAYNKIVGKKKSGKTPVEETTTATPEE